MNCPSSGAAFASHWASWALLTELPSPSSGAFAMGILKGFGTHGASICSTAAYIGEPEAEALPLLLAVFIAAVCGLVYELLAGTLSSYLLGDSVTQCSLVIGIFLTAMDVGSYLFKFIQHRRLERPMSIELWVGGLGGC